MDPKLIGKIVKFHRKKSGLTQVELATLAGLGKTVIYDLEKGKLSMRFDTILKVLRVLNITIEFHSQLIEKFKEQLNEKG